MNAACSSGVKPELTKSCTPPASSIVVIRPKRAPVRARAPVDALLQDGGQVEGGADAQDRGAERGDALAQCLQFLLWFVGVHR